jgi:hypothetical protein
LLIPNGNLRPPNHPVAPQPRPRQPAPQKLLGLTYLDYVRDEEGRKGAPEHVMKCHEQLVQSPKTIHVGEKRVENRKRSRMKRMKN